MYSQWNGGEGQAAVRHESGISKRSSPSRSARARGAPPALTFYMRDQYQPETSPANKRSFKRLGISSTPLGQLLWRLCVSAASVRHQVIPMCNALAVRQQP
ncbi:hypothetical protein KCP71_10715 [Salmonella enterica subsp. enterica]|nr:hypothetical protein KCP71_10715 [Salmonella enterica subsp. enterica]